MVILPIEARPDALEEAQMQAVAIETTAIEAGAIGWADDKRVKQPMGDPFAAYRLWVAAIRRE